MKQLISGQDHLVFLYACIGVCSQHLYIHVDGVGSRGFAMPICRFLYLCGSFGDISKICNFDISPRIKGANTLSIMLGFRRLGLYRICLIRDLRKSAYGKSIVADQLRGNHVGDKHLCLRFTNGTTHLLLKSSISPSPVAEKPPFSSGVVGKQGKQVLSLRGFIKESLLEMLYVKICLFGSSL